MGWFQLTGCMSLFPLLVRDGQTLPYWACCFLYLALLLVLPGSKTGPASGGGRQTVTPEKEVSTIEFLFHLLRRVYLCISIPGICANYTKLSLLPLWLFLHHNNLSILISFMCCFCSTRHHMTWHDMTGLLLYLPGMAAAGVLLLHAAEASYPAPSRWPDLYPALFALFGCCSLLWNYVFFARWLLLEGEEEGETSPLRVVEKKRN
jgi:hypothetical protein